MHVWIFGGVDHLLQGVKDRVVFGQTADGYGAAADRVRIAAIVIERLVHKIDGGGLQHAAVGGQGVLADNDVAGDAEKMSLQKITAEQFVAQAGGNAVFEVSAGIDHIRIYFPLQPRFVVESGRERVGTAHFTVGHDGSIVAYDDVGMGVIDRPAHFAIHVGSDPVVAVYKRDIAASACAYAVLSGAGVPSVGLVQTGDMRVSLCILVADGAAAVGGTVVYKDDLIIGEILIDKTVEALAQIVFYIIDRDDHA